MDNSELLSQNSLELFFFEQLESAQDSQGDTLSEDAEAYVVHLLASYCRKVGDAGRLSPTFALQFMKAHEKGTTALRSVGDRALFVAGVVPRSLDRGPMSVNYVCSIGEQAYHEVFVRHRNLPVFSELSQAFHTVVDLLSNVVSPGKNDETQNLLQTYERWRRSGHAHDERRLLRAGVLLDPDSSDTVQ